MRRDTKVQEARQLPQLPQVPQLPRAPHAYREQHARRSGQCDDVWPDTGCDIAPKCLECPLPACRYDLPPRQALFLKELLDYAQYRARGYSVDKAALYIGRSRRAGFRMERVLREAIDILRSRAQSVAPSGAADPTAKAPAAPSGGGGAGGGIVGKLDERFRASRSPRRISLVPDA